MKDGVLFGVGALFVSVSLMVLAAVICAAMILAGPKHDPRESWAIQGVYSQLDCHNQPGKTPHYEMAPSSNGDGDSYFMYFSGCQ